MKTFFLCLGVILFISYQVMAVSPVHAQDVTPEPVFQEDFENGIPPDWKLESGWKIIQDEDNMVLAGQGHSFAYSNMSFDDFKLSFRVKLFKGNVHFVFRQNDKGRYFFSFQPDGAHVSKQYWPNQFEIDRSTSVITRSLGTWHTIEIEGHGGDLKLTVDDVVELTETDLDPILEGSFAFESLGGTLVYIDDISVTLGITSAYFMAPESAAGNLPAWIYIGGHSGGLDSEIRIQPGNPDQLFIASVNAGVFTSSDGGRNWNPLNKGIPVGSGETSEFIPISALAIDPSNSEIMWAGTQAARGIFKSLDGGKTWTAANDGLTQDAFVNGLAVDPRDSQLVYSATINYGLLKTNDGGQSWQRVHSELPENSASAVAINHGDPGIIFAAFDRGSLFISRDGGSTWKPSLRGMMSNMRISAIVFDPIQPLTTVYATDLSDGVYRSTDGGISWQLLNDELSMRAINALAISTDGKHLYAASEGRGVFRLDIYGEPPPDLPDPTPVAQAIASATAPSPADSEGVIVPNEKPSTLPSLPCGSAAALPLAMVFGWLGSRKFLNPK